MDLKAEEIEDLRIGALLHDIGKIGIADTVLQKTGKLTSEEFALIQQHPTIGRRILEGAAGFQTYLPIVELHHEDWNAAAIHGACVAMQRRRGRASCTWPMPTMP
jgi:HD-GYP domain-containing protein (c-di-GMP phosphodiesterase class II)